MVDRNIGLISAGVAFFTLLAVFPAIAAFISLFGVFADPAALQNQLSLLQDLVPPAAFTLLENQVMRLVWSNDGTLGWAGLVSTLTALFLARQGVDAMLRGMNTIYGSQRRTGVRHLLTVAVITLGMVLAGVVALLALLVLPVALAIFPLAGLDALLVEVSRWSVSFGMVALWLWVFYKIGPVRDRGSPASIRPGLALAMVLWILVSVGFSYFLSNFGRYNEVYGSLGAVVALLMWFYLSAYVVLLGGVVNAMIDRGRHVAARKASPMSDESGPPATG
ncbi:YihY/virulence factor BrkB family protein [Roseinatronobacter sp. NSM]|uniref:YihY/virulence factor BrkB family protein n=1 Tax=Roseinatronobacter sp. NSM TaxID=3457785 RepID=UPI0040364A9C